MPASHTAQNSTLWSNVQQFSGWLSKNRDGNPRMRAFWWDFELKILRMRGFSSRFLDNQPENCCIHFPIVWCIVHTRFAANQPVKHTNCGLFTTKYAISYCVACSLHTLALACSLTTKPGLWTMDWTVDWTMDWDFLYEMTLLLGLRGLSR